MKKLTQLCVIAAFALPLCSLQVGCQKDTPTAYGSTTAVCPPMNGTCPRHDGHCCAKKQAACKKHQAACNNHGACKRRDPNATVDPDDNSR